MNGSTNTSPELPLPVSTPEIGVKSAEVPGGIETKSGGTDSASQGPVTAMPMVDPSQFAAVAPTPQAKTLSDDQVVQASADDEDVIEKEWVSRAKAIVNKTKDNPSVQSKELVKFKAEYIKKRFNKDMVTAKETAPESQ